MLTSCSVEVGKPSFSWLGMNTVALKKYFSYKKSKNIINSTAIIMNRTITVVYIYAYYYLILITFFSVCMN